MFNLVNLDTYNDNSYSDIQIIFTHHLQTDNMLTERYVSLNDLY